MFLHPWFLLLFLLLPYLLYRFFRRGNSAINYSSACEFVTLRPTLRQRLSWLPTAFSLAALVLMIIAMARPRDGKEKTFVDSEGIAIEMVVDRSSSMQALDFQIDGQRVDRLSAIKKVAGQFVLGEDDESGISGRTSDRIGLISFAGFADAITPPTLDHRFLVQQLQSTEIAATQREDGTAIGDAISLAVEKLSSLKSKSEKEVESKVVILLTDGENTAGIVKPIDAAELAQTLGIKIYTIGVGTNGKAPFPIRRLRNGQIQVQYIDVNIDEETLTGIATETGGKYFRATDTTSLEQIYSEIDELERTEFQTERFVDYRELAVQPFRWAGFPVPPLLAMALVCLALRLLLSQTLFRSLT